ncbi:hypothetical protein ACFQ2P_06520 [Levilactobacillus namurensis]|nr:hypothetical protein [Levilactobacillus namurensis]
MTAIFVILLIIVFAGLGQLYLDNRENFRKKSKHLATHDRFSNNSNQRFS